MDGPTQPSTQPRWDERRSAAYASPEYDDVICILQPSSPAAHVVNKLIWKLCPQYILQYSKPTLTAEGQDESDGLEMELAEDEEPEEPQNLDIALRTSANVKDPVQGFVFGRDDVRADIVVRTNSNGDHRISGKHFRIWVNSSGILMLQDTSTNGTFVDDDVISQESRMLTHGTTIEVVTNAEKSTKAVEKARFNVKLPQRRDDAAYKLNLQQYLLKIEQTQRERQSPGTLFKKPQYPVTQPADLGLLAAGTERFTLARGWTGNGLYNVVSEIGKGAFATVYKVATTTEGKIFAAKRIERSAFVKNGVVDTKFYNELNIMKKIDHPHIVLFHHFDLTAHHLFIVMEYIPFGDMAPYANPENFLGEFPLKSVARQLLHALNYIHHNGIVHRDIKPENILVTGKEPFSVKLSDFGLSKMIDKEDKAAMLTFCGTLLYCAPEIYPDFEQVRQGLPRLRRVRSAAKPYSSAVDIWSLGTVLFHFLASKPPFKGSGEDQGYRMLHAILFDDLDFIPLRERGVGEPCLLLLRAMMDVDGNSRPQAEELLDHEWIQEVPDLSAMPALDEMAPLPQIDESRLATVHEEDKEDEWNGFDETESFAQAARDLLQSSSTEENGRTHVSTSGGNGSNMAREDAEMPTSDQANSSFSEADPPSQLPIEDIMTQLPDCSNVSGKGFAAYPHHSIQPKIGSNGHTAYDRSPYQANTPSVISPRIGDAGNATIENLQDPRILSQRPVTARLFGEIASEDLPETESGVFGAANPPVIKPRNSPGLSGTQEKMEKLNVGALSRENSLSEPTTARSILKGKRHRATTIDKLDDSTDSSLSGEPALKRSMVRPNITEPTDNIRTASEDDFSDSVSQGINTLRLQGFHLGTLYPIRGSFSDAPLNLTTRLTTFGRELSNTHVYPHPSDTRVARAAMDIYFYSPASADYRGPGWHKFDGTNAVIMTRSQRGIRVNGTKLPCSPLGGPFKCGKLRNGDHIELFRDEESHLTYRCELNLGESMQERRPDEAFVVEDDPRLFAAAVATRPVT